jgi:hypothetical protein
MPRTRASTTLHPTRASLVIDEPIVPVDDEHSRVVARPDGFYWVADDGHQEFGPFVTAMDALIALRSGIDTGLEPESLFEAEADIGYIEPKAIDDGLPEH